MKADLAIFEGYKIRRLYDESTETWYFSVVDVIRVLTQQPDFQAARKYWNKLKERLNKEGSETVTKCNRLKMPASDGKKYKTDMADPETLNMKKQHRIHRLRIRCITALTGERRFVNISST